MLSRILIANRGEIACRIIRTCRRLGVETIAVYSVADAGAQHVLAADRAVCIGPAAAAESYLRGDRIIEAAVETGAEAIHPGYGFLSENPEFAEAVEAAGLVWIGPPPAAIRAMGLKDAAKKLMQDSGVPVTPGYHGADQDPAALTRHAAEIGYPVLIKAAAGGGGKGMRRVDHPVDFAPALEAAKSEARASFGNDHVLIEKYISNPRHIEVQVFADADGGLVHLFERDCSLQRRHQKVIEEAPAPGMTGEVREAMTRAALRAAEAVGYRGAGTVEFIAEGGGALRPDGFWFMEMNTRLQVEHPVTEAVTGVDLVEWQLRVAAGERLPLSQGEISLDGHAVEARIYAEDPARGFLPQTGRIAALELPTTARVESGVAAGDIVGAHYDPMIAKIIVHGRDRAAAFRAMGAALDRTHIEGLNANTGFLARLVRDERVIAGEIDTGLITDHLERLTAPDRPGALIYAAAAIALANVDPSRPDAGWRPWGPGRSHIAMEDSFGSHLVSLAFVDGQIEAVTPDGHIAPVVHRGEGAEWRVEAEGSTVPLQVFRSGHAVEIAAEGTRFRFRLADPATTTEEADNVGNSLMAPLPGLVKTVLVEPGHSVGEGAPLAVMEAMKMEHTLRAPRAVVVETVAVAPGAQVEEGAILMTFFPEEEEVA